MDEHSDISRGGRESAVMVAGPLDLIRKNPLGIYVHSFNWSQDLNPGDSK